MQPQTNVEGWGQWIDPDRSARTRHDLANQRSEPNKGDRGRDRLCLVQIADSQDRVACVRIGLGQSTAPNLQRLFEAASVEKVFHFARFDVAAATSKRAKWNTFSTDAASNKR